MEALQQFLPLLLAGALAALVLCVGLDATLRDVSYVLRHPGMLLRAVIAVSVIVPIAAAIMIALLPLPVPAKAGLMLMALAPVPPLVPGKGLKAGGRREYVYGLYVAFAVLAVILAPLGIALMDAAYGVSVDAETPQILRTVLVGVLAPLLIGMAIHAVAPAAASAAAVWVGRLAMLLLVVVFVPLIVRAWPAMVDLAGDGTVLAMLGVAIVAVLGGHLLGGPDDRDRAVLASAAATRHPGIAILIANANFTEPRIGAAIIMMLLISLVVFGLYQLVMKRAHARAPAGAH